jgi:uncharacterized lipoprotein YmbA
VKKVIIVLAVMLAGCSPSARELNYPVLPEGLKDCKFYEVSSGANTVTVVRCPGSTATTRWTKVVGKTIQVYYTAVVD